MALHFSKRIEIIEEQDSTGPEPGLSDDVVVFKPWADIKTLQGREIQTLGLDGHAHSTRFIIRYRDGIKNHMKVKYKGKTYNIISNTNDNEQNDTITLVCEVTE